MHAFPMIKNLCELLGIEVNTVAPQCHDCEMVVKEVLPIAQRYFLNLGGVSISSVVSSCDDGGREEKQKNNNTPSRTIRRR